jgi:hypothetical protein
VAIRPDLERRISDLRRELGDDELEEAIVALAGGGPREGAILLARLADRWSIGEAELLDAAASLAARHQALGGEESELRNWLALLVHQSEFAQRLGGKPRHVLEEFEQSVMLRAKLEGEAVETIWREPMLEPKDAAVALGARAGNREKVRQYRERSWLLGLPRGRGYLYPAFQFDPERRDVFPEVRAVNERLRAAGDPWGVASWWVSSNTRLGTRPMDLVGTARASDLVAAAEAVVEPVG